MVGADRPTDVIPELVPGIRRAAIATRQDAYQSGAAEAAMQGIRGWLDPGHKARDDSVEGIAMISAEIAGALILAVPALMAAWIVLRRQGTAIFLFAAAMILVGVGYLTMTGATADIARGLLPGLLPAG